MKLPHLSIRCLPAWSVVIRNAWTSGSAQWGWLACLIAAQLTGSTTACADALQNWAVRLKGPLAPPPESFVSQWDVTYGNSLFVAVGHNGQSDYGTIYSSPDGGNWIARHQPLGGGTYGELRRVIFANGKFLAVGWNYARYISEDGTNWTGGFAGGLSSGLEEGFRDVCFGQGKYVAIDGSSSPLKNILTSLDGGLWQRQSTVSSPRRIGYGNGRFVILCERFSGATTPFYWSSNGNNWFLVQINFALVPSGVTWGNGMFVAVGNKPAATPIPTILTSLDGESWTPQEPGVTNFLSSVQYIDGLFVATGDSVILTSSNGMNWDSRAITNKVSRFAYGNGTLVGISGNPGSAYWGQDLLQSDPLLKLGVTRENPSALNVTGVTGRTIQIESSGDAGGPWEVLDTFSLTTSPYLWTDATTPLPLRRLYRATWIP